MYVIYNKRSHFSFSNYSFLIKLNNLIINNQQIRFSLFSENNDNRYIHIDGKNACINNVYVNETAISGCPKASENANDYFDAKSVVYRHHALMATNIARSFRSFDDF